MEGQVLGNRYELLEKVGGGGMAVVYKAKCKLLNRFVAVKVLKPEFNNDEEFVKRFIIEAQAAASLSHPNIVSIYDVGHEDNSHYIVMEYIDGTTLKEYVAQKGVLTWKEAVNIAIQVCSALENAHRNHIVHRDIKPHNILLTRDGVAKVTDFGIARAATSSTITMVGSTIGSVHYFSPEQARGGFTDEKSDIYALGVTLYEMVTGKVPFDGDTPVAVALKHLQVDATPPAVSNPDVPRGVNDIIMKAIEKEQNERYQTASDMLENLYRVLKEPGGAFVVANNGSESFATKRVNAIGSDKSSQGRSNGVNLDEKEDDIVQKKKDKRAVWLAVGFSSLIILITIGAFIYGMNMIIKPSHNDQTEDKTSYTVQDYKGKAYDEIKDELAAKGIEIKENWVYDDKSKEGTILSQSVEEGKQLKVNGGKIELSISKGPQLVKVPDLKKMDYRQAESKLSDLGMPTTIEEEYSDSVVVGLVTRTDPEADTEIKPGTSITIYKSKGPEIKTTVVPDLVGKTKIEAQKLLSDAHLTIGKVLPEDGNNYIDKIASQNPKPQTKVNEYSSVDINFEIKPEENTGSDSNVTPSEKPTEQKYKKVMLALSDPDKYGDKIKVTVKVVNSITNDVSTIMDEELSKTDFPLPIMAPVPDKGTNVVTVLLNNKVYTKFTEDAAEVQ